MATVVASGADPVNYTISASKAFVADLRLRVGSAIPAKSFIIHYPLGTPAGFVADLVRLSPGPVVSASILTSPGTGPFTELNVSVSRDEATGPTSVLTCTIDPSAWSGLDTDIDWQVRVFSTSPMNCQLFQLDNNIGGGSTTVRRVMCDPNSGMLVPVAVLEKKDFTLFADGAVVPTLNTVVPAGGGALGLPTLDYQWTNTSTLAIPALDNVPATSQSPATPAPGVYGATNVDFTQRTYFNKSVWAFLYKDAPLRTLVINPRNYRMILLLDRSGSMLSTLGGGDTKWAATVKAAHVWADLFVAFRNGVNAGDLVGVMIFEAVSCGWSGTVATPIQIALPDGGAPGTPGVLSAINSINVNSATFTADLQNPGSCTPIGDALISAMKKLASGGGIDDRYVIVLMTDGIENSGTIVVDTAITLPSGAVDTFAHARSSDPTLAVVDSALQLYTIGVGSTVQASVLDDLPNTMPTAGYYRMATNTQELLPTFAQILGHAFEAQAIGPAYDGGTHLMSFPVPANEHRLAVVLQWAAAADDLKVSWSPSGAGTWTQIYGPGTVGAPAGVAGQRRDTHGLVSIDLVALGVAGAATDWKVEYVPNAGANDIDPAKFLVMVDLHVKADFSFDRTRYVTGDPIVVSARILAGGVPVTNATVSVELARPGQGLGTFLATNAAGYQPPQQPPPGADPADGKAAMTQTLLRQKEMSDLPVETPPAIFSDGSRQLFDDGAHSDGVAGDGVYANVYTGADKEGTYTWRFYVQGKTPAGGNFTRLMTVSKWVGVNVDPIVSEVAVVPATPTVKGMSAVQVSVVPVSNNNQYLGPFRPNQVAFRASAGTFSGTVTSLPNGTYTQILNYPPGKTPVVTVSVQGKDFPPIVAAPGCLGMIINAVRALYRWLLRL